MRFIATLAALVVLAPAPAAGQTIIGRLLDASTREGIGLGSVTILAESGDTLMRGAASEEGHFRFTLRNPSAVLISAAAVGYRSLTDGVFEIGRADTIWTDVLLTGQAIQVQGVRVEVAGRAVALRDAGFYERQGDGFGTFRSPEWIERNKPTRMDDFFVRLPRIRLLPSGGRTQVLIGAGRRCYPTVVVDGVTTYRPDEGRPLYLDQLGDVSSIEAMEVYTGASQVPAQFNSIGSACGVVVIWTSTGRR